ncbi:MAG: AAA family ATPase [Bacteroidales bacterium]|jgi:exodeoxyribonuclease-5|nr:AAA family ATPase [Bacteroidales bacterium]
MLNDHVKNTLIKNFELNLTPSQSELIDLISDFFIDREKHDIFIIKGFAGTGKTTIISTLVKAFKELKMKSVLLAPTGRAAKVISAYTKSKAYTIHKKIYRQKSAKDGFGEFVLNVNLYSDTYFIVDEASMISNRSFDNSIFGTGKVLDDLIEFVFNNKNCRLILVGDTAQLPPIGLDISPALEIKTFDDFYLRPVEFTLTDVVRQTAESGVLSNATNIRLNISKEISGYPSITLKDFNDIKKINGGQLLDLITESYDKFGIENTIIITRSNKRANRYNAGIRSQILWKEEEISLGDYLMVVKNNYFWLDDSQDIDFIANGDIAEVISIKNYTEIYGFRYVDVSLKFVDYKDLEVHCKILLDTLNVNSAALSKEQNKDLFYNVLADYQGVKGKQKKFQKVKENPFFNALQVKFAYAVTCHKAQGGQWKSVFIDHEYLNDDMMNKEYLRWLYTAFTRPTEKLYLINFNKEFFGEDEVEDIW